MGAGPVAGPTGPWMLLSRILFRSSFPAWGSWLRTLLVALPVNTPGGPSAGLRTSLLGTPCFCIALPVDSRCFHPLKPPVPSPQLRGTPGPVWPSPAAWGLGNCLQAVGQSTRGLTVPVPLTRGLPELLDVQCLKISDCVYFVQTLNCFRQEDKSSSCFSV